VRVPSAGTIGIVPEQLPIRPARPDETADVGTYKPTLDRTPARKSVFEEAGGLPFFEGLVDRFYDGVETDAELLAIYPDHAGHLAGARHRLALFLAQYWGGPTTYTVERGQPQLYLRHMRFAITTDARDRWLTQMRAAIAAMDPPPHVAARLLQYFDMAAEAMRNKD
jgi:hemoglobin